ncbi:YbaK/EbsC family protein [Patescibacteria group bacterium]|nr:YbaK/EbsC family protein [Patescibacteria group bacterium]
MPISKKLLKFLEKAKIKYEKILHRTVYTAYDKAQTLKVPEKIVGKTLVMKFDRDPAVILIPANKNLDKGKFKKLVNKFLKKADKKPVKKINFVTERWMKKNLKGVKVGAIPPFGSLWQMQTFIDKSFLKNPKIILNAGDYNWSIKITPKSFKKLIPDLITGNISKKRK